MPTLNIYSKPYLVKKFSQFNIQAKTQNFTGDKIKIERLLNREIQVFKFKIEDSKFGNGKRCLHLQIGLGENKHVVFTGSNALMDLITQVPETDFPFSTTIVKENERLQFT
jgi:hypothetical protein